MAKEIAPILTAIFQRSFDTGIVPKAGGLQTSRQSLKKGRSIKIVCEYDQEIPQSQTADKPMSP